MSEDSGVRPMEDPNGHLLPPDQAKTLLEAASTYAAGRLAEFEARAHYVHEIHTRE